MLYFLCPVTGERCRILYKCYGSKIWKSRDSYSYPIYYPCQVASKKGYFDERYWTIERRLDNMSIPVKKHYRGAPTRPQRRIIELEEQLNYYDELRFMALTAELYNSGLISI